ncbi:MULTISPECIES: Na(+)/H(+) antiporter subunit B [Thermococcus]|uniref:Cation:proton antiporter n=1 Tax=Thermococcus celericrescens TaxID=227598 RepID=A0A124EBC7_9EURY|nr:MULTISPECIES: Na(+)/H(+) antiporter subunit B [Thermococcus]AEK73728.1 putative monovalent cation/H+ antiporter subunit B [Thermococcus sp. 4557]KUH33442.1 cation:proton antiporter [Thermococcus celericrescens]NJE02251.1 cation:proton antiporter [Thermococcus sp. JdF3]
MKMSTVVRTTTKMVSPFLVTYAAYLMLYGHVSPGGGFQGGVILAVAVILLITSHGYGKVRRKFHFNWAGLIESSAGALLVLLGIAGLGLGAFYSNFLPTEGGIILPFNVIVGLEVGAAFTFVFYILLRWVESD